MLTKRAIILDIKMNFNFDLILFKKLFYLNFKIKNEHNSF